MISEFVRKLIGKTAGLTCNEIATHLNAPLPLVEEALQFLVDQGKIIENKGKYRLMTVSDRKFLSKIEKIIEFLERKDNYLSIYQISKETDLPYTSVRRVVYHLIDKDMVDYKENEIGRRTITVKI